jgi:hypothetical protein
MGPLGRSEIGDLGPRKSIEVGKIIMRQHLGGPTYDDRQTSAYGMGFRAADGVAIHVKRGKARKASSSPRAAVNLP